jgi:hypothetical protein
VDRRFDLNFSLRPNTRLTGQLGSNYSDTLYSRVSKDPLWPVMQYYVFADYLECGSIFPWSGKDKSITERAARWLPALSSAEKAGVGRGSRAGLLTRFSQTRGIELDTWNMDLRSGETAPVSDFNTGRGNLQELVIGRAMHQVASQPESGMKTPFAAVDRPYLGKGPVLGCEVSSPDAQAVWAENRSGACKAVMEKIDQLETTQPESCPMPTHQIPLTPDNPTVSLVAVLAQDAQEGRVILEQKCSKCHSGSSGLGFLASTERFREHLSGDGRFNSRGILGAIREGEMPPIGKPLSTEELKKVSAYIDSLTAE